MDKQAKLISLLETVDKVFDGELDRDDLKVAIINYIEEFYND